MPLWPADYPYTPLFTAEFTYTPVWPAEPTRMPEAPAHLTYTPLRPTAWASKLHGSRMIPRLHLLIKDPEPGATKEAPIQPENQRLPGAGQGDKRSDKCSARSPHRG